MSHPPVTAVKRGTRIRNTADKHLGLMLGSELLVVPILAIQEIVGHQEITPVPRMPPHVRGVINLRGRVLAVVDLRIRLGMEPVPATKRTCIVVAQVPGSEGHNSGPEGHVTMGLLVDQVTEVIDIPKDHIDAPPDLGGSIEGHHLTGIARLGQKVAMVIDLPQLLGAVPHVEIPAESRAG